MTEKTQTIFRVIKNPENPFVMMDKRALADPQLSYKAKGILAYLLSRPDNWTINIVDVVNHSPDGEFAVRTGIKELIFAGYVQRKVERNEKHQIVRWVIEVYEQPQPIQPAETQVDQTPPTDFPDSEKSESGVKKPDGGFLHVGFPHVENLDLNNKELSKKENMGAAAPARSATKPVKPKMDGQSAAEKTIPERIADFPTDCQPGAELLLETFNLHPPEKPAAGQKGGDFALWINGLRELAKIAADYDTPLDLALHRTWQRWNQAPFNVSHPGALVKTMTGVLAQSSAGQNQVSEPAPTPLEQALKNFKPRS